VAASRHFTTKGSTVEQGTVKWFSEPKGYGFINCCDGSEAFVHFRDIQGEGFRILREGQRVEFERTRGPKGISAKQVQVIE